MKKQNSITRSQFIQRSLLGVGGIVLASPLTQSLAQQQEKPAPLKIELAKEFVTACHSKLDRTKEMLENDHLYLHCSYDWGGGDFESGIEGAGHMGNKEIANYLLSKGARYNVYLACMLGHLETVKNVLTFNPSLLNSKGPHGFTMLHHAQKGGDGAKVVADYLVSLGAKETKVDFYLK
jgi:ankyrin repeat protein